MQSQSLELGRQVEQILMLLVPILAARPKRLQLLFTFTQFFVDIEFDLVD